MNRACDVTGYGHFGIAHSPRIVLCMFDQRDAVPRHVCRATC